MLQESQDIPCSFRLKSSYFYAPVNKVSGVYRFCRVHMSICLSLCLFVHKNLNLANNFWFRGAMTFIFFMCFPCNKIFLWVPPNLTLTLEFDLLLHTNFTLLLQPYLLNSRYQIYTSHMYSLLKDLSLDINNLDFLTLTFKIFILVKKM